jgi:hypothetical protein
MDIKLFELKNKAAKGDKVAIKELKEFYKSAAPKKEKAGAKEMGKKEVSSPKKAKQEKKKDPKKEAKLEVE